LYVAFIGLRFLVAHRIRKSRVHGPQHLRRFLERAGGTYLKFGQVLSLQPDVVPPEYCEALFDLLDRVPPFSSTAVKRIIREDLGAPPEQVFDSFDSQPMASASIAQVHRATLNGEQLAVKIRRPSIERVFGADLAVLRLAARIVATLRLRRLRWFPRAVGEFSTWTREELDFRFEARYMIALRHNAHNNPTEEVPRVLTNLSTARVLVADFLDGPTVLDYIRHLDAPTSDLEDRLDELGFDAAVFATNLIDNFVWDAFQHGLFHADLHPANLIILEDNVVGYVDFGITGSLSTYSRRHIVAMTLAITRADTEELIDHFLRIAVAENHADVGAFRRKLRKRTASWFSWRGDTPTFKVSYSRYMLDFLNVISSTGIGAMPDALRYLRSVVTADGLINRFASKSNVAKDLERLCRRYLERDMWRRWMTTENLVEWAAATARLVETTPQSFLGEQPLDSIPNPSAPPHTKSGRKRRRESLVACATLVAISVLILVSDETPFEPTFDLAFGASIAALLGAMMFVVNVFRGIGEGTR
jgi:ubiquinone biosynthesis protein